MICKQPVYSKIIAFFKVRRNDKQVIQVFEAQAATLSARQKWLASGSVITGRIVLDKGAVKAIQNRKSLLSVGVLEYIGEFEKGEVVEILDPSKNSVAIARCADTYASE